MFVNASSRKIRANFRAYLDHVMSTGDRVLIFRHSAEVAALVCKRDFEALEAVTEHNRKLVEYRHEQHMERMRIMKEHMRKTW